MENIQEYINTMSKAWRADRSLTQMTLGQLIARLEEFPTGKQVENIDYPHSYRGYYSDLAFEHKHGTQSVESLLSILKTRCLNKTFEGYKGGDFKMDENTPLWIAEYGNTGKKIMGMEEGFTLTFTTAEDEY